MKCFYHFGPFILDPNKRSLSRDGKPVPLTSKAFDLLVYLAKNPNRVVTKDEIMKTVWAGSFVEEGNLTQNVFLLRKALSPDSGDSGIIVTIPRMGYQFAVDVQTITNDNPALAIPSAEYIVAGVQSTTRVVVEEEVEPDDEIRTLEGHALKALPAPPGPATRHWPLALVVLVVMVAGALWFYLSPPPLPKVLRSVRLTHAGNISPYSRALSDDSRIYLTQTAGGIWKLAQVPASGGDPTLIATSLASIELQDIDNTKSRLLVTWQGPSEYQPLWLLPTTGGSAERLGDIMASDAIWSVDGRSIFYSHRGDMFRASADGSQPRKLFSLDGRIHTPRQSPDGTRLRFTLQNLVHGGRTLWEANADGTNPHAVALGWKAFAPLWGEGETDGDWTPDGSYFVFRSTRDNVETLWMIREKPSRFHKASSVPVQIYSSADHIGQPRFSADGKRLLFVGHRELRELVRYDTERKLFVPYLGGIPARHLAFSADGQWVVYHSTIDGTLWRSRLDGSEKLQLTFPPMTALHSSWSPDGKTIVFQGGLPGQRGTLYTVPASGGKAELLLQDDTASLAQPSWCGDGRSIVFMHWPTSNVPNPNSGIGQLDLATHQSHLIAGSSGFDGVHCSPDGKYIAASDEVNHNLVLYDFAQQRWSVLSAGSPYGWGIRWSTDSRYVYYQHIDEGEEQPIFRVRISDRLVEQVSSARQILRADVLSYTLTGLTPDSSPVASLVRRNSDITALELDLP